MTGYSRDDNVALDADAVVIELSKNDLIFARLFSPSLIHPKIISITLSIIFVKIHPKVAR